jgi:hypothetical protein
MMSVVVSNALPPNLEQSNTASPLVVSKADYSEDSVLPRLAEEGTMTSQTNSSTNGPTDSCNNLDTDSTTQVKLIKRKYSVDTGCSDINIIISEENTDDNESSEKRVKEEEKGKEMITSKVYATTHQRYGIICRDIEL